MPPGAAVTVTTPVRVIVRADWTRNSEFPTRNFRAGAERSVVQARVTSCRGHEPESLALPRAGPGPATVTGPGRPGPGRRPNSVWQCRVPACEGPAAAVNSRASPGLARARFRRRVASTVRVGSCESVTRTAAFKAGRRRRPPRPRHESVPGPVPVGPAAVRLGGMVMVTDPGPDPCAMTGQAADSDTATRTPRPRPPSRRP